jgi:ParB-like chromosome segregation protein Spo0J
MPKNDPTPFAPIVLTSIETRLGDIRPGPYQKRRRFAEAKMIELIQSLEMTGLINPPIVFQNGEGNEGFLLISGERRWRALCARYLIQTHHLTFETAMTLISQPDGGLQLLNQWGPVLDQVVSVRLCLSEDKRAIHHLAIHENVHNDHLNPIEEAREYQDLRTKYRYSIRKVSQVTGKNEPHIRDTLVLLKLDEPIQELIAQGKLHRDKKVAMALLSIESPAERIKMAGYHSDKNSTIETIVQACAIFNQHRNQKSGAMAGKPNGYTGAPLLRLPAPGSSPARDEDDVMAPMVSLALAHNGITGPLQKRSKLSPEDLQAYTAQMCEVCAIRRGDELLKKIPYPA